MANSSSVSEVELSLSTVIALNEASVASPSSACSTGAGMAASVTTKANIVAMSGAIMPEPLAMPASVTGTPSIVQRAAAPFGNVSVVMIAPAAAAMPSARSPLTRSATRAVIRSTGSRSPITPVEATNTSSGGQSRSLRHRPRLGADGRVALGTAKHVGVAGIDDHRARPSRGQDLAAPDDRMPGRGRAGEDPGDGAAGRHLEQKEIVATAVADPGGQGGEAGARNDGQVGKPLRGQGRALGDLGHGRRPGR